MDGASRQNASPPTDMTPHGKAKAHTDPTAWPDPYTMPAPSFDSFPDLAIPSFQAPPISSSTLDHADTEVTGFEDQHEDTFDLIPSSPDIEGASSSKSKKKSKRSNQSRSDKVSRQKEDTTQQSRRRGEQTERDARPRERERSRSRERHRDQGRDSVRDRDRGRDRDGDSRRGDESRSYQRDHRRKRSRSRSYDRERDRRRREHRHEQGRSRDKERSPERYRHDRQQHQRSSRRASASPERAKPISRDNPSNQRDRPQENDSWSRRREHDNANRVPAAFPRDKTGEWVIDIKGDAGNVRYDQIDKHAVPQYNRAGGGKILGDEGVRIDHEKTKEFGRGIVTRQASTLRKKVVRYTHAAVQLVENDDEHKMSRAKIAALAKQLAKQDARGDGSFISMELKNKQIPRRKKGGHQEKKEEAEEEEGSSSEEDQASKLPDYRDIHGFTKPTQYNFDADIMEQGNAEDAVTESKMDQLIRERLRLDKELRQDPKQPAQWLAFIAVNNAIDLLSTKRSHAARLKGSSHSIAHLDIVLSMFERALQANPTDSSLLLNYLNCARLVWEPAKLLDKWDEILTSDAIQSEWPAAWIEYLNFRQRHFHSFTVSTLVRVVSDGLATLGRRARLLAQALSKAGEAQGKQPLKKPADRMGQDRQLLVKIENVMVHLQARAWTFLKEAGYGERAYGIIQAEMEFLYHAPEGLEAEPLPVQIASMEEYWDSELPRFSESGAKGWAHYVMNEEEVEMNDALASIQLASWAQREDAEMIEAIANKDVDRQRYRQWARREQEWSRKFWFPVRTTDSVPAFMEDDPYGIVLFEDVEPFVAPLYSIEARRLYLECVIHFAGLPAMICGGSNALPSGTLPHPFVHDGLLHSISTLQPGGSVLGGSGPGDDDLLDLSHYLPPRASAQVEIEQVLKEVEWMQQGIEPPDRDWNSVVWHHPLAVFPMAVEHLFASRTMLPPNSVAASGPGNLPWASVFQGGDAEAANKAFLAPSLEQLSHVQQLSRQEQRAFQLLLLFLESASTRSPTKSQKMAKRLLKDDRMDLELWNAYAQMEKSFGRIAEARKVYNTVLSMYKSFPEEHQKRAPLLYRSFAELEWEQGRPHAVLTILVAMAHPTEPSALEALEKVAATTTMNDQIAAPSRTMLAKTRQILNQMVAKLSFVRPNALETTLDDQGGQHSHNGHGRWFDQSLDTIVCLALFEYMAPSATGRPQQQVHAAINVFDRVLQQLTSRYPDDQVPKRKLPQDPDPQPSSRRGITRAASSLLHEEIDTMKLRRENCGVEAEMVWTQMVKFVYWHDLQATTKQHAGGASREYRENGGYRLGDLRQLVEQGLARFPNNSILQSVYFWTEARQRISGRVRSWVLKHAEDSSITEAKNKSEAAAKTPSRSLQLAVSPSMSNIWAFGVFYELWHQIHYNIHGVRTILDAALGQSPTPTSSKGAAAAGSSDHEMLFPAMYCRTSTPLLWRLYLEIELREAQVEYERQMQLYQQTLRAHEAQQQRRRQRQQRSLHRHKRRRRHDRASEEDSKGSSDDVSESDDSAADEKQSGSGKRRLESSKKDGQNRRDGAGDDRSVSSLPKPPTLSLRPKDLLLRALQDCPWCKDLYLLAFLHPQMRTLFSAAEMEQLYRTMLEKELRVHQELPVQEDSQNLMESLLEAVGGVASQPTSASPSTTKE